MPFFDVGAGFSLYNFRNEFKDKIRFTLSVGGGFRFYINESFGFCPEIRFNGTFIENDYYTDSYEGIGEVLFGFRFLLVYD